MSGMALISEKPQTLKDIRLNHSIALNDLAFEAQVSRHAVLRMEQLCYSTPLPSVIAALSDITGLSELDLEQAYDMDVRLNRIRTDSLVFSHRGIVREALDNVDPYANTHQFQQWRENVYTALELPVSRIHFSSDISVHPATLDKFESFKSRFPRPLEIALTQCGVDHLIIRHWRGIKELAD
jgi:hypothetical protein